MNPHAALSRYHEFKSRSAALPHVDLHRSAWIKAFLDKGGDPKNSEFHADICQAMGSYADMGNSMARCMPDPVMTTPDVSRR